MPNYTRFSYVERVQLYTYLSENYSWTAIAKKLGRSKSTISRELGRFPSISPDLGRVSSLYFSCRAQALAEEAAKRPKLRKMEWNGKLNREVLAGLRKRWSPDQISKILRRDFPNDETMRISPESIYTYIYVLPRGVLRSELMRCLRQEKKSRRRRAGSRDRRGRISQMISIEERPAKVAKRSLAGDWEGDLIVGKNHKTALGTLVERKTRAVLLVRLTKKEPSHVRRAFERKVRTLPVQMRRTLTYDQGKEMAQHRLFTENTQMKVYFCHPASPWERGTCENTNGLLRQYFPKGTDFSKISPKEILRVQHELNDRPRKTLDYCTPREVLNSEILRLVPLTT